MQNNNLFDTIKQKEQHFIKTLKDIAEAAFITDSLDDDHEMDDKQVDSDLSKVASEIAKSTSIFSDDNSDADFEMDEKLDDNGCDNLVNGSSSHYHDHDQHESSELQTVIKVDVMEAINETSKNNCLQNGIDDQEEDLEESDVAVENNTEESSWKIDYIRVETEEKKKALKRRRNEVWKTNKPKKDKGRKHHSNHKRSAKKYRKLDLQNFESKASEHDKKTMEEKNVGSNIICRNTSSVPVQRKVDQWDDVVELTEGTSHSLSYLSSKVLDDYNPSIPRGTSHRCIQNLSEQDLEMFACPACQDKFLLPVSFFQHIYRRSVIINFDCKSCNKIMVFHNKCSLKIHLLSHLENDNIDKIKTDMIEVLSLNNNKVRLNSEVQNFAKELRNSAGDDNELCKECLKVVEKDNFAQHFSEPTDDNNNYKCSQCHMSLPTKCSLSAHNKIHQRMSPYICPECGTQFYTFDYFKRHVLQTCYHNRKTMMNVCPYCPTLDKFTADRQQVFLHIADKHCNVYLKCSKCPSAYGDKAKLSTHWSEKHSKNENVETKEIYRIKIRSKLLFFTDQKSLVDHLSENLSLPHIFVFACVCPEYFSTSEEMSEHLQNYENCKNEMIVSDLFPDDNQDIKGHNDTLDNLKYLMDESHCSSCIKYNENYQRHVEKHTRKSVIEASKKMRPQEIINEETEVRLTRRMRRTRSSETYTNLENFKVEASERVHNNSLGSPPLKLKIKLVPEATKSSDQQECTSLPPTPAKKEEKKKSNKNSKVKFNIPEPIVESLGIDVPSGKDLILLNHLFHSPQAFFSGSIVKSEELERRGYECSVCSFREQDRSCFQNHIVQHKSCQSHYQCQECGACFAVEPSWKKHLLLMHRIKDPGPEHFCQDLLTNPQIQHYEEESELSEDGDLVIDTGDDPTTEQEHSILTQPLDQAVHLPEAEYACNEAVQRSHIPTCLACGENFFSTNKFKEHKCDNNIYESNFSYR